jgi:hypothetical protein
MIKRVAFKIDDAEGMNKVLAYADMVPTAGMAINEGWVNFSVDDGEADDLAHQILDHKKVLRNDLNLLEATKFNMTIIEDDIEKLEQHRAKKEIVENKKEWESAGKKMEEILSAKLMTEAEIYRLEKEIRLRRDRIEDLQMPNGMV